MQKAKRLLLGMTCEECKYCKIFASFVRYSEDGKTYLNKPIVLCDYENIAIYRKKGMEMPMNKNVEKDDWCKRWEK